MQSRAGKGIKAGKFSDVTGRLVNLKQVGENDDIMIISDTGIIIRMYSQEVSLLGRDTQGVRMMRLKEGGNVVCVAVVQHQDEEAEASAENTETQDTADTTTETTETVETVQEVETNTPQE